MLNYRIWIQILQRYNEHNFVMKGFMSQNQSYIYISDSARVQSQSHISEENKSTLI
jgi:hypothetical protein